MASMSTSQVSTGPAVMAAELEIWPKLSLWDCLGLGLQDSWASLGQDPMVIVLRVSNHHCCSLADAILEHKDCWVCCSCQMCPASGLCARFGTFTVQPERLSLIHI